MIFFVSKEEGRGSSRGARSPNSWQGFETNGFPALECKSGGLSLDLTTRAAFFSSAAKRLCELQGISIFQ